MWSYFGAKTNVIDFYPAPKHNLIIEPFAGTARYSLKHFENDVIISDKYEVIINMWRWLQKCSIEDINRLPHFFKPNQSLSDFSFDCEEAKNLLGFCIGFGMERPRKTASAKRMLMRPNHVNFTLNRIAKNLFKIRHWDIRLGDYSEILNKEATYFIDPPYQFGGHCYIHSNKSIDFQHLSNWAKSRNGQVIVCENTQADWMDFKPMVAHKGVRGMQKEAIWSNELTSYDTLQTNLFY